MKKRQLFCRSVPTKFPTREEWFNDVYEKGQMIPEEKLVSGKFYFGDCRNSVVAMWCDEIDRFVYRRSKFGTDFLEMIKHPINELDSYDVFIPHVEVEEVVNLKLMLPTEDGKKYFCLPHNYDMELLGNSGFNFYCESFNLLLGLWSEKGESFIKEEKERIKNYEWV